MLAARVLALLFRLTLCSVLSGVRENRLQNIVITLDKVLGCCILACYRA